MKDFSKIERHGQVISRLIPVLRSKKFKSVLVMPVTASPFDLLVDKKARLEVKVGGLLSNGSGCAKWHFNLHRHNKIVDSKVDFFVLAIPDLNIFGIKRGLYLVIPGEDLRGK